MQRRSAKVYMVQPIAEEKAARKTGGDVLALSYCRRPSCRQNSRKVFRCDPVLDRADEVIE